MRQGIIMCDQFKKNRQVLKGLPKTPLNEIRLNNSAMMGMVVDMAKENRDDIKKLISSMGENTAATKAVHEIVQKHDQRILNIEINQQQQQVDLQEIKKKKPINMKFWIIISIVMFVVMTLVGLIVGGYGDHAIALVNAFRGTVSVSAATTL